MWPPDMGHGRCVPISGFVVFVTRIGLGPCYPFSHGTGMHTNLFATPIPMAQGCTPIHLPHPFPWHRDAHQFTYSMSSVYPPIHLPHSHLSSYNATLQSSYRFAVPISMSYPSSFSVSHMCVEKHYLATVQTHKLVPPPVICVKSGMGVAN